MTAKTPDERILDLYARYRETGWRFRRLRWKDGRWGIGFTCAGAMVQIQIIHGMVRGFYLNCDEAFDAYIHVGDFSTPLSYETLYRRLDKKAGVTRGK